MSVCVGVYGCYFVSERKVVCVVMVWALKANLGTQLWNPTGAFGYDLQRIGVVSFRACVGSYVRAPTRGVGARVLSDHPRWSGGQLLPNPTMQRPWPASCLRCGRGVAPRRRSPSATLCRLTWRRWPPMMALLSSGFGPQDVLAGEARRIWVRSETEAVLHTQIATEMFFVVHASSGWASGAARMARTGCWPTAVSHLAYEVPSASPPKLPPPVVSGVGEDALVACAYGPSCCRGLTAMHGSPLFRAAIILAHGQGLD